MRVQLGRPESVRVQMGRLERVRVQNMGRPAREGEGTDGEIEWVRAEGEI